MYKRDGYMLPSYYKNSDKYDFEKLEELYEFAQKLGVNRYTAGHYLMDRVDGDTLADREMPDGIRKRIINYLADMNAEGNETSYSDRFSDEEDRLEMLKDSELLDELDEMDDSSELLEEFKEAASREAITEALKE